MAWASRARDREWPGDPLLLVTGLGGNTDQWTPFMEQFRTRRIIRFDAPGTGQSSTPMYLVSIAESRTSLLRCSTIAGFDGRT